MGRIHLAFHKRLSIPCTLFGLMALNAMGQSAQTERYTFEQNKDVIIYVSDHIKTDKISDATVIASTRDITSKGFDKIFIKNYKTYYQMKDLQSVELCMLSSDGASDGPVNFLQIVASTTIPAFDFMGTHIEEHNFESVFYNSSMIGTVSSLLKTEYNKTGLTDFKKRNLLIFPKLVYDDYDDYLDEDEEEYYELEFCQQGDPKIEDFLNVFRQFNEQNVIVSDALHALTNYTKTINGDHGKYTLRFYKGDNIIRATLQKANCGEMFISCLGKIIINLDFSDTEIHIGDAYVVSCLDNNGRYCHFCDDEVYKEVSSALYEVCEKEKMKPYISILDDTTYNLDTNTLTATIPTDSSIDYYLFGDY